MEAPIRGSLAQASGMPRGRHELRRAAIVVGVFALLNALGWTPITGAVVMPLVRMLATIPSAFRPDFYALLLFRVLILVVIFVFSALSGLDLIITIKTGGSRLVQPLSKESFVMRLSLWQRVQHWWLVTAVAGLALTGFAKIDPIWGRSLVSLVGGASVVSDVHIAFGIALGALVLLHAISYGTILVSKLARSQKIDFGLLPTKRDFSDVVQTVRYDLGISGEPPQFGKYSFMQKFDYWGVYWGILVLGVPGLLMWLYGRAFWGGIPFIFHTEEALLCVLYLALIHLYNAHFNPRTFPLGTEIITGKVPLGRAHNGV